MKKLIFLLLLFSFTSCLTVSKIERNCDKFEQICVTDTKTETVTVWRDTMIYQIDTVLVLLPSDTITITETITVKNNQAYLPPIHKEFGLIGVDVSVARSVLNINAYLTDSTILHTETDTTSLVNAIKERMSTTTKTITLPPEKHIPDFYRFTFWWFIFSATAILFWLAIKIMKPKFL